MSSGEGRGEFLLGIAAPGFSMELGTDPGAPKGRGGGEAPGWKNLGEKKKKSQFQAPAEDPQDLGRDWNLGMHRNWGIRWNLGNLEGVKFGNAPGIWEFLQFGNCKLGIL